MSAGIACYTFVSVIYNEISKGIINFNGHEIIIEILFRNFGLFKQNGHGTYKKKAYQPERGSKPLVRFELNAALNHPARASMYGGGEKGYTDYPTLN